MLLLIMAYARVFWPEIDRTDIDLVPGKYEWEMSFRYEDMIIFWFSQNGAQMTLSDKVKIENLIVLFPHAYT